MSNIITTCEVSDKDVIKAYNKFVKAYYTTEDIIQKPKPKMTKVTKHKFLIFGFCHFWFLLRCGCVKPFLVTISESWSILEYIPYLDRFFTGKTR